MSRKIPTLNVVEYVKQASQVEEYKPTFEGIDVNNIIGAFEFMLNQYSSSSNVSRIYDAVVEKFLEGDNSESSSMNQLPAISVARVLFSKYLETAKGSVSYDVVPLYVNIEYKMGVNSIGQEFVKTEGFTITWLQKPVDSASLKEGLTEILNNSGYTLQVQTYSNSVCVSVGSMPGLLNPAEMVELVNELLDNKGYQYTIVSTDLAAVNTANEIVSPFADLLEGNTQA